MTDQTATPSRIKVDLFFWILVAFVIFAAVAAYSSRMTHDFSGYDQQRAADRYATLAKLQADERQVLTTADWVDQDKKIVRIPIDEAMTRELDTLKAKPVQMGTLIPVVASAAPATNAPAAAAPATNAPAATPPPVKPTP